jgi:hypothetical protein
MAKGIARVPQAALTLGYSEMTYAVDRQLAAWVGRRYETLIGQWGQPLQTLPKRGGGQFLVFADRKVMRRSVNGTIQESRAGGTVEYRIEHDPIGFRDRLVFRVFEVDERGTIVDYSWRGL